MKRLDNGGVYVVKIAAVAMIIFLTTAPVFYLLFGSVRTVFTDFNAAIPQISISLLATSVLLYLIASLFSVFLGFLSATFVWTFFEKFASKIVVILLILILIPPFIHVQAWISFADFLNGTINNITGLSLNFTGYPAVVLTVAFSYLPVSAGLCLVSMLGIPSEISDMTMIEGPRSKSFAALYLPYVIPAMFVGAMLIFLLNINDYGIPSVFGVNVYSLELFAGYSAGGNIYSVFISSLPLLIVSGIIIFFFSRYIKRSGLSYSGLSGKNPFKKNLFMKISGIAGGIVLFLFAAVPLTDLIFETIKANGAKVLADSSPELVFSIFTAFLTSVLCLIPAMIIAFLFAGRKKRSLLLSAAAIPFLIPAPVAGISLIGMWNTRFLEGIYQSPIMPALGMMSRFTFIEALILSTAVSRLDPALTDNMRVHYPGRLRYITNSIRLVWRETVAAALIVFALAAGEFGISLLVTPPGYQTFTVKIYNYVHYGSSEIVAAMCLFMLALVLLICVAILLLFKGKET